jgi:hypothetical protein
MAESSPNVFSRQRRTGICLMFRETPVKLGGVLRRERQFRGSLGVVYARPTAPWPALHARPKVASAIPSGCPVPCAHPAILGVFRQAAHREV